MRSQDITTAIKSNGKYYIYSGSTILVDDLETFEEAYAAKICIADANNACENRHFNAWYFNSVS